MVTILNPFKKQDAAPHAGSGIPLQMVRSQSDRIGADESAGDGDEDDQPLLHSDGLDLDRLRGEIEKELSSSGVDSAYDRMYSTFPVAPIILSHQIASWYRLDNSCQKVIISKSGQQLSGILLQPAYATSGKSKVINKAIQDIGMGKYQWELFTLCGMGWLADNLWMQGLALVLPQLSVEFGVSSTHVRYTTMITYVGLSFGSTFWGIASDIIGRRPAFNATLFICGLFGAAVAAGPSWITTSLLFGCMGLGVGGNLPVDGALFLEFLPFASNKLLTLLSVWWPVGQLIASLIAWALIPPYSCETSLQACFQTNNVQPCCAPRDNRGWRYFIATLGVMTLLMFVCRFFLFHLYESPKFLLSRGRQAEAVSVVQSIARYNGTQTWLTEDILDELSGDSDDQGPKLSVMEINKRTLSKFSFQKVESLFINRKLGTTTVLLWFMWATIGMGYPLFNAFLPQYLEHAGGDDAPVPANVMYRNFMITSVAGVPGSIIACYTVDMKYIGRKGTMAVSTLISGVFLYLFTLSSAPGYQTLCSSVESFFQNVMYGVLYAYTPEVFPAPSRGTGTGIASLLNRIAGLAAPIVAAQTGALHPSVPILAAGACYLAASVAMILLPIETRGKQSL